MDKKRPTGSTGERLLNIMRTVADADDAITLPEITDAARLPKPTAHRLVTLLEEEGYLIKDADGRRYIPGPQLRAMAHSVIQGRVNQTPRHMVLQRVADKVKEACNLVLLDGAGITYIDRIDAQWPLNIRLEVGSHVPLHCTATGKLLLSLQPKRVRSRLIAMIELTPMTAQTITERHALEDALTVIRKERVGTDNQEFIDSMVAVSVPIPSPRGPSIAAISTHAPVFRRSLEDLRGFIPDLREAAEELAELIYK